MKRYLFFLFFAILPVLQSNAQVETQYFQEGDTTCFVQNFLRTDLNTKIIRMPAFDLEKMQKEDAEMEGLDAPYRFGKGFDVSYTLSDGLWQNVEGGRLWSLTFESEGAISLNYIFENMYLPEGASLFIINHEKTVVYGPVTSDVCVPRESTFLTDVIPGASSTIYLFEPLEKNNESTLTIKRVIHGYRGFDFNQADGTQGNASSCNIDVACYPAYENESKGIALVMLSDGDEWCSGSLLMSTDLSFTPYILTAFHCLDSNDNGVLSDSEKQAAENWMFKFCFKKNTCNGSTLATSYTYNKANFCSAWSSTDFALMKLKPTVSYNTTLTWLGWDKGSSTPTSGIGIHHPQGDVMKISIENNHFGTSCSYLGNNGWDVNFDYGIVEFVSSGSPILNQNNRVVGQLCGGTSNDNPCYQTNGQYGKLYQSWTGGNSNDTRLSDWLDPIGTGQTTMDSSHPIYMSGPTIPESSSVYSIQNLPSGYDVTWTYTPKSGTSLPSGSFVTNSPAINQCTINNSNKLYINGTLNATITRNGTTINTLQKSIRSGNGFSATCSQPTGQILPVHGDVTNTSSTSATFTDDATFSVKKNSSDFYPVTITSPYFTNSTITHTSITGLFWSMSGNTITLTFPKNNNLDPALVVTGVSTTDYRVFRFTIFSQVDIPLQLMANISGGFISLTLSPDEETARGISIDEMRSFLDMLSVQEWDVTVSNVSTGQIVYETHATGSNLEINTTGWSSGIYAIKVCVGSQVLIQKVVVR